MLVWIVSSIGLICCTIFGTIVNLGRSQNLTVTSIENPNEDIYSIHLTKPDGIKWKAGSYAEFILCNTGNQKQ